MCFPHLFLSLLEILYLDALERRMQKILERTEQQKVQSEKEESFFENQKKDPMELSFLQMEFEEKQRRREEKERQEKKDEENERRREEREEERETRREERTLIWLLL